MNDITNFRLSQAAQDVAQRLVDTGKFECVADVAKFAFAYAVKNFYDEFNPATYVVPDGAGSNYNVGTFDDLPPYVKVLYPDTDTPYIYVRALINFGLIKIGEVIDREGMPKIYSICCSTSDNI